MNLWVLFTNFKNNKQIKSKKFDLFSTLFRKKNHSWTMKYKLQWISSSFALHKKKILNIFEINNILIQGGKRGKITEITFFSSLKKEKNCVFLKRTAKTWSKKYLCKYISTYVTIAACSFNQYVPFGFSWCHFIF